MNTEHPLQIFCVIAKIDPMIIPAPPNASSTQLDSKRGDDLDAKHLEEQFHQDENVDFNDTADKIALEVDGALACASGSQMWNGKMAAFEPRPTTMKTIAKTTLTGSSAPL
ncbi:MAG: hypothetical protein MZU97_21145 [Bacillus subtilis]|nr:hypothetical protein [Bacillus subtilis]